MLRAWRCLQRLARLALVAPPHAWESTVTVRRVVISAAPAKRARALPRRSDHVLHPAGERPRRPPGASPRRRPPCYAIRHVILWMFVCMTVAQNCITVCNIVAACAEGKQYSLVLNAVRLTILPYL